MFIEEVVGWPENGVTVKFNCPHCNRKLIETVRIPNPDFTSEKDTYSGTMNQEDTMIECRCGKSFTITAIGTCSGNSIVINELPDSYDVDLEY